MVKSCCVRGCHNRQDRESDRRYFQIPSVVTRKGQQTEELTTMRRKEWLAQLKLSNYTFESTTRRVVCSDHFIDGKIAYLYDIKSPSWKPTLKLGHDKVKGRKYVLVNWQPMWNAHKLSQDQSKDDGSPSFFPWHAHVFPHNLDHDYAVRVERHGEEQSSRKNNNSRNSVLKSQDAHDFHWTSLHDTVQDPGAKKSTPPSKTCCLQKSGNGSTKKAVLGSSPQKKGKDKLTKKRKKVMESSGQEHPSPASKVSLRALLSGRKNTVSVSHTSKKAKGRKKTSEGRGRQYPAGSGAGPPTQSQGLKALLEAANQIEGMGTQMLDSASISTNTTSQVMCELSVMHVSVAGDSSLAGECIVHTTASPFNPG